MIDQEASDSCRAAIKNVVGHNAPGATYYVLRDGKPFVEASFGSARRSGAPDGALAYGADTIVHIASVSKFICAVAVLRLIEDWNEILSHVSVPIHGQRYYAGPRRPKDAGLIQQVVKSGKALSLATTVYELMSPSLNQNVIAAAKSVNNNIYPGTGIASITLQELLTHTSGLRDRLFELIGHLSLDQASIIDENAASGKAVFDLRKFVTIVFSQNCDTKTSSYCNDGFSVAGAFVEFVTGEPFEDWCRRSIFPSREFDDIARRPIDMSRAARYYQPDGHGGFTGGNYHPDYRDFGACGGWYTSARAFCQWVHAVMHGRRFGGVDIFREVPPGHAFPGGGAPQRLGHAIIADPVRLLDLRLGLDGPLNVGYLRGEAKNGGTSAPGTSTNARFVYMRGYGDYSVVAFTQANGSLDANPLLEAGLPPLRRWLYNPMPLRDDGLPELLIGFDLPGLQQLACWDEGGARKSITRNVEFASEPALAASSSSSRTNMFGTSPYAPNRTVNSPAFIRLRGFLRPIEEGVHTFRLTSDDGSMMWIDDQLTIDNDGSHAVKSNIGSVFFRANKSAPITIYWYNIAFGGAFYLEWRRPGHPAFEAVPIDHLRQGVRKLAPF